MPPRRPQILKKSTGLYSEKRDALPEGVREVHKPNPRVWLDISISDRRSTAGSAGGELGHASVSAGAKSTAEAEITAERIEIELWADRLPKTAENFRALVTGERGLHPLARVPMHYKGSPIHRIIPGLMIQGGDFVCADGTGGESIYGAYFADEGFETKHDEPGLLCMANAGRDTNRSQWYITTAAAPHLDGRHVVFGRVSDQPPPWRGPCRPSPRMPSHP